VNGVTLAAPRHAAKTGQRMKQTRLIARLAVVAVLLVYPTAAVATPVDPSAPCVQVKAGTGRYVYRGDLAEWMTCMYPPGSVTAHTQELGSTILPGSHQAGTDVLFDFEAPNFDYVQRCSSGLDRAAQGIKWINRQWGMAQTRGLGEQASAGSRWFDLSGVWFDGRWRACDSLATDYWDTMVTQVEEFNVAHPNEVLVIDVSRLYSPANHASERAMAVTLAPLCRRAVRLVDAPQAAGNPGLVTIEQARDAGGLVLQMADDAESFAWYHRLTDWLAMHPGTDCEGKLWSRARTRTNYDEAPSANLWQNRKNPGAAARSLSRWNTRALKDNHGSFEVSRFTWDFTGPSTTSRYQIWLMNNWLVDLNTTLAARSDDFVRSLWRKTCATGIPANVILMDNIYRPRIEREIVAYNQAPC
jgi:hypothetical protein